MPVKVDPVVNTPYLDPNGVGRYYPVRGEIAFPSFTTVLSQTASWKDKKILENWNAKNPGKGQMARDFGTSLHKACEEYLRHRTILSSRNPRLLRRFGQLKSLVLDRLDSLLWVEGHMHLPIKSVFHEEHGVAGCPDWIGHFRDPVQGSCLMLMDLKTSSSPYCRWKPRRGVVSSDGEAGYDEYRSRISGFKKFEKARMQVAGYIKAANWMFDLGIKRGAIVVSLEDDIEYYPLSERDIEVGWEEFQHRLAIYYRKVQEGKIDPICKHIPERYRIEKKRRSSNTSAASAFAAHESKSPEANESGANTKPEDLHQEGERQRASA